MSEHSKSLRIPLTCQLSFKRRNLQFRSSPLRTEVPATSGSSFMLQRTMQTCLKMQLKSTTLSKNGYDEMAATTDQSCAYIQNIGMLACLPACLAQRRRMLRPKDTVAADRSHPPALPGAFSLACLGAKHSPLNETNGIPGDWHS